MNQIIFPEKITNNLIEYRKYITKRKKAHITLFILSSLSLFIFIGYYIFQYFNVSKKDEISQKILSTYDIQQLYATNNNITPVELPHVITESGNIANIIGIIEISKIDLRYPVLSETTDEFLNIAPCKFYGPDINSYGNFCIAGHNLDNGDFFSDLYLLEKNDIIDIYSLNR